MKKVVAPTAFAHLQEITSFIFAGNPEAARRYRESADRAFFDLDGSYWPRRASERLPEYVRELSLPGFRGYVLRVAYLEDKIGLIAAFRPGLTDGMKNRRTHKGLREARAL